MNTKALFSVLGVTILALVLAVGMMIPTAQDASACTSVTVTSSGCGEIKVYKSSTENGSYTLVWTVPAGGTKTITSIDDNWWVKLVAVESDCCKFLNWTKWTSGSWKGVR